MSWRPAFWLVLLVSVTGVFLAVFEAGPDHAARAIPLAVPLVRLRPDSVTRLVMTASNGAVECVVRDGQWFMVRPVAMRADAARVRQVLETLAQARRVEVIDAGKREKRNLPVACFGLDPARARLVVGTDVQGDEIELGDPAPIGDKFYARVNRGDEVVGVAGRLSELLPLVPEAYMDHAVFPALAQPAVRVEVKHAGGFVQLVLHPTGWRIQQPYDAPADSSKVEALLRTLTGLEVVGYGEETGVSGAPLLATGVDDAVLQISLWTAGRPEPFILSLGKPRQDNAGLVSARLSDAGRVAYLKSEVLALTTVTPDTLRDRRLSTLDPARLVSLSLKEGEQSLALDKGADSWLITDPVHAVASERAVAALLHAVSRLEGDEVRAAGAASNPPPPEVTTMTCRLVVSTLPRGGTNEPATAIPGAVSNTFRFNAPEAPPATGWVYAEESHTLYRVGNDALAALWGKAPGVAGRSLADPLPYIGCRMLEMSPALVRKITLSHQGREETVTVNAEGLWTVESPPDGQLAENVVPGLLEMVSSLQAERAVSLVATNRERYGLGEPMARLTFGLSSGGIQKTLLLGNEPGQGGVYAMVQGQETIYLLRRDMANALMKPLVRIP